MRKGLNVFYLACACLALVACGPSTTAKSAIAAEASAKAMKVAMQSAKMLEKDDLAGAIRVFDDWLKELDKMIAKTEKDPSLDATDKMRLLTELRSYRNQTKMGLDQLRELSYYRR